MQQRRSKALYGQLVRHITLNENDNYSAIVKAKSKGYDRKNCATWAKPYVFPNKSVSARDVVNS
jgi:hypothetical protein